MRIDASGTATDSEVFGGTLPRMQYEAHLADNGLAGRATGEFQGFDPARIAANPRLQGNGERHGRRELAHRRTSRRR